MSATIIAKNHLVIKFWVNGQAQYIVEKTHPSGVSDKIVATIKRESACGDTWQDVYNAVDATFPNGVPAAIESAIDRLSFS